MSILLYVHRSCSQLWKNIFYYICEYYFCSACTILFFRSTIIHLLNINSLFFISLNLFLIIFFIWEIYLEFYLYVLALIFQALLLSLLTPEILKNIFKKKYSLGKHSLVIYLSFIYHISFPSDIFHSLFLHYCGHTSFLKFSSPHYRPFFKDTFPF